MAATYGWIITRDYNADTRQPAGTNSNAVGVMGPRDLTPAAEKELKQGHGKAFRMYDDDRILYYAGRIVGTFEGLEPLDDFGTPNAGCTELRMFEKGKGWVTV